MEAGDWRLETGGWRLEAGDLRLEAGDWRLEAGDWRLGTRDWRAKTKPPMDTDCKSGPIQYKHALFGWPVPVWLTYGNAMRYDCIRTLVMLRAGVVELADTHGSGPCAFAGVGVQVPSPAPR